LLFVDTYKGVYGKVLLKSTSCTSNPLLATLFLKIFPFLLCNIISVS